MPIIILGSDMPEDLRGRLKTVTARQGITRLIKQSVEVAPEPFSEVLPHLAHLVDSRMGDHDQDSCNLKVIKDWSDVNCAALAKITQWATVATQPDPHEVLLAAMDSGQPMGAMPVLIALSDFAEDTEAWTTSMVDVMSKAEPADLAVCLGFTSTFLHGLGFTGDQLRALMPKGDDQGATAPADGDNPAPTGDHPK